MKKLHLGLLLGIGAGIVDVIPMFIMKLTWDSIISAFIFWIIAGFFIATSKIRMTGLWKGIIISLLLITPLLIIIGWKDQDELIPILVMNIVLGGLLGSLIARYGK